MNVPKTISLLVLVIVPMTAHAQGSTPVTEAALRALTGQPERIIVVRSADKDIYIAIRASGVSKISGTTLEIVEPADSIAIEKTVRVLGEPATERPTKAVDVVDVLSAKWQSPLRSGTSFWQLGDGTRKPAEMLQNMAGQTQPNLKIEVKEILTWWCQIPGPQCQNPK